VSTAKIRPPQCASRDAALRSIARQQSLISLRSDGHGFDGFGVCDDGGIVIDLSRLKRTRIALNLQLLPSNPGFVPANSIA
jgi:hypothetical protein